MANLAFNQFDPANNIYLLHIINIFPEFSKNVTAGFWQKAANQYL